MKFEITEIVEFDYNDEINRINELFEDPWKSRLFEIMDAFKNAEYEKVVDLYENLPYDTEEECPGQEYCKQEMLNICFLFIYHSETIEKIE